jgi:transposase
LKSDEEIMQILEAFDLTGSLRAAAELAGCSHHTVARLVAERAAAGGLSPRATRPALIDEFLPKVEEWVEKSHGKIRGDVAHEKLAAMGFTGSPRTSRRAVAEVKANYRLGRVRVHRPWVTEPGLWLQYDFGDGPTVDGARTVLFCAWLAWCRFRVVMALRDRTIPTVFAALDTTFRLLGGAPTYVLTDNEKSVTVDHVARIPVRNQQVVAFGRHYSVTVHTCQPRDPASKGGVENAVKLAKADIVPTDTNLADEYPDFAALEAACTAFMGKVNGRVHSTTRRVPAAMLAEEVLRLHPVPAAPHTVTFGETRTVAVNTPMVTYQGGSYSVPHQLLGATVWVRVHGAGRDERVVIVHVGPAGAVEVARHRRAEPGSPQIDDAHFPPAPPGALDREPVPRSAAEAAFLDLGAGAALWLKEAAAQGTSRIRVKMDHAVSIAKLTAPGRVDWALGHAAVHQRFGEGDLASILAAHPDPAVTPPALRAGETSSLTQGTAGWAALGTTTASAPGGSVQQVNTRSGNDSHDREDNP